MLLSLEGEHHIDILIVFLDRHGSPKVRVLVIIVLILGLFLEFLVIIDVLEVDVPATFHEFKLIIGVKFLLGRDLINFEEVLQRLDNVVHIVKFVVFHIFTQKHMGLSISEAFEQHFHGVLERNHRIHNSVEYDCWAFNFLC